MSEASTVRRPAMAVAMAAVGVLLVTACLPSWPSGEITTTGATPTTLDLSWPAPTFDADATIVTYEISVDGGVRATVPGNQRTLHLDDLAPATTYTVAIRALDSKGQWSAAPPLTGTASTAAATSAITERRTIVHDGLTRTYRLDIPAGYTGATGARLVIGMHGGGGTPDGFASYTRLPAAAAAHGWVVAYPEGTGNLRTWNGGGCCGAAQLGHVDDVGFVSALRGQIAGRFAIDATALVGHSNGAIFAYRFACERPDEVDGIGIYAGTLFVSPCAPARPVSLLHVHGLADTNLPFAGGRGTGISGVTFPPVMNGVTTLAQADGCDTTPATASTNGVVTTTWPCPAGTTMRLVTIDDANHEWAGGVDTPLAGTPSTKVDTTATLASFIDAL